MVCSYRWILDPGDEDDPVTMTNQDKEVVATYEYDAWGNVLKSEAKGIAETTHSDMRDTCMIKRLVCIT